MSRNTALAVLLIVLSLAAVPTRADADALAINFDQAMMNAWTQSGVWPLVTAANVLQPSFSLLPSVCDVNGGFDISVTPVILYPNGILDSDEFAMISAILANPAFDCTARGGASHKIIHDAWNRNYSQIYHDLGCCVGGPEVLLPPVSMIPDVEFLFCAMMTIGDMDTQAFPIMLMDLVVNNETVNGIIGDPNLHVPDPTLYSLMFKYLAWCGDADGDGWTNLEEYQYYYPTQHRAGYLAAALDPNMHPPGTPSGQICDGTGGLLGEYFDERTLTNLKLTRLDQQVAFDWGGGTPAAEIGPDTFSVCWTGYVTPVYTEVYDFLVRTDDGVRLWVDNQLLVDEWNDHGSTTYTGTTAAPLEAGHEYSIRMEMYENGGDAVAWLGWESARQVRKAIYEMYLRPGEGEGDRTTEWFRNPQNGHYYKITPAMTWLEARDLAQSWGGYLVTINDAAENTWIFQTFGVLREDFFIGGNDLASEGAWAWVENGANFYNGDYTNGVAVTPWFANWASAEPNNAGEEDAAQYYWSSGQWNDLSTTQIRRALVESNHGYLTVTGPTPTSGTVWEGSAFTFSVGTIRPYGHVTYQWKLDGDPIPGATNASCVLNPVQEDDAGLYSCVVSDEGPSTTETGMVQLTVIPRGALPASGALAITVLLAVVTLLGAFAAHKTSTSP